MKDYIIGGYQPMDTSQVNKDEVIKVLSTDLTNLVIHLRQLKPGNRGDLDRRFAVAITDAEKLDAYITQYILVPIGNND